MDFPKKLTRILMTSIYLIAFNNFSTKDVKAEESKRNSNPYTDLEFFLQEDGRFCARAPLRVELERLFNGKSKVPKETSRGFDRVLRNLYLEIHKMSRESGFPYSKIIEHFIGMRDSVYNKDYEEWLSNKIINNPNERFLYLSK